jgi:chemotaxis protein histidine kinase CheA
MLMPITDPVVTTDVCVVETGGTAVALLDRDLVCILPLEAGSKHPLGRIGDLTTMVIDGRPRPLVSLRETLCLDAGGSEDVVVVIRLGDQLFGLTVERVRAIEEAIILPTLDPPYPLAMFAHLVDAGVSGLLTILNPARLALCIGATDAPCLQAA